MRPVRSVDRRSITVDSRSCAADPRRAPTPEVPVSYVLAALAVLLGAAAVVGGGADDSPGLQGIGVLLVLTGVVVAVRAVRARRSAPR